jgi:hypothetical protein
MRTSYLTLSAYPQTCKTCAETRVHCSMEMRGAPSLSSLIIFLELWDEKLTYETPCISRPSKSNYTQRFERFKTAGPNQQSAQLSLTLLVLLLRSVGPAGTPPSALQPFEAYCAKPRFSSPSHLQRRSSSDDVRDLY